MIEIVEAKTVKFQRGLKEPENRLKLNSQTASNTLP